MDKQCLEYNTAILCDPLTASRELGCLRPAVPPATLNNLQEALGKLQFI
jgi:hypothetical protein